MATTVPLLSAQDLADRTAEGKGAPLSHLVENRLRLCELEQSQGSKSALVEQTHLLGFEVAAGRAGWEVACAELSVSRTPSKPQLGKPLACETPPEQRQSVFAASAGLQEKLGVTHSQEGESQDPAHAPGLQQLPLDVPAASSGSTICSEPPGVGRGEQKSAFSKPAKRLAARPGCSRMVLAGGGAEGPRELSGLLHTRDIPCWTRLSAAKLVGDFWNLRALSQNIQLCGALQGRSMPWLELTQARVPMPLAPPTVISRALLPPTLSFLGLSTQNWCAKCSLAFRLTTDLVFHMRSHHKREHVGPDPHSKKRRGEALTCPVCHEYFRERHHLSRHMTSHS